MTATPYLGLDIMIDVAMTYLDSYTNDLDENINSQLTQAFSDYLHGRSSYEDCQSILLKYIGRDEALVRIHEIMTLPDEPLPSHDCDLVESSMTLRKKTRTWTSIEDQRLLAGVARFGLDNWQTVAHFLGSGRNRAQCSQRWTRGLNPKISKKSWSQEDDKQLQELVNLYGDKSWTKIANIMGNRSDVQCRYHYRQLLNANNEETNVPLKKSSITMSSDRLVGKPESPIPSSQLIGGDKEENDGHMSLFAGRTYMSSPGLTMPKLSSYDSSNMLLPLMPITPRQRHAREMAQAQDSANLQAPFCRAQQHASWGVCGTDPDSLNNFLSNFT